MLQLVAGVVVHDIDNPASSHTASAHTEHMPDTGRADTPHDNIFLYDHCNHSHSHCSAGLAGGVCTFDVADLENGHHTTEYRFHIPASPHGELLRPPTA